MKKRAERRDILPLSRGGRLTPGLPTGEAFRPEWIDFEHGIRVGNLEPHERITQILKYRLEQLYGTCFVTIVPIAADHTVRDVPRGLGDCV